MQIFVWGEEYYTGISTVDEQHHALVDLFNKMIPDFKHKETGKYLDGRM